MQLVLGLLALWLAPSGDPRAIDPAANRPEIVAPGGSPAKAKPPKTRPPKAEPKPKVEPKPYIPPKIEPEPEPEHEPTTEPKTEPKVEPKTEPKVEPKTEPEAAGPQKACFPERGRCWRLNVAGIAAASVGVAALGTGIGFMQAPQFPVPDEPIYNRSLRPPGVVMVAVGAITAVTGVLMIVAGHATHRRPRSETARVQLVPGGVRW